MQRVVLQQVVFEKELPGFVARLAALQADVRGVEFDFSRVKHYIPAAIAAVVATVKHLETAGRPWRFLNHDTNPAFSYFERMDVCALLNINLPWNQRRHDPGVSFVPLKRVDHDARCETIANELAGCMSPDDDDAREVVRHLASEMMLNVRQHAGSPGFAAAQYVQARDYARIGVADYGHGILGSFRERLPPFYHKDMTDMEAVQIALQTGKSSTHHLPLGPYGGRENAGVGLSMAAVLVRLTYGEMVLISGSACTHITGDNPPVFEKLNNDECFSGTVVSICLRRKEIGHSHEVMAEARRRLGLHLPAGGDTIFES